MATVAQRFYHSTTEQDFTASGEVDIRKLLESAPGSDATTKCTHPTAAGTTDITIDPYTNSSTQSDIRANCGWAINRLGADGMGSTATAKRVIKAGTWTFKTSVAIPAAGTTTGTLTVSNLYIVYRVSASGARTSLFTASSNTVASAALAGANSGVLTATASASEILLEADETIHVGIISHMVQVAGLVGAVVSGVATYTVGTTTEYVEVAPTGVLTRYLQSFLATMIGVASIIKLITFGAKVATMIGVAIRTNLITLMPKLSTMIGLVTAVKKVISLPKVATMVGVVSRFNTILLSAKVATMIGVASTNKLIILVAKVATMVGVASFSRLISASRSFTATMVGVPIFARSVIAVRMFSATMIGITNTWLLIPQSVLNRMSGGGTTVVTTIFAVLD